MAIVRWNPWSLSPFFDDDEWDFQAFNSISRNSGQGLNIYETDKDINAEVALPGISEDKIDVSIDDGVVRISASSEDKTEEKGQRKYFMSSMASSYNYSFRLPEGIAQDKEPEATLQNGVLKLSFTKAQITAPKKIQIKSAGSGSQKLLENTK